MKVEGEEELTIRVIIIIIIIILARGIDKNA